MVNLKAMSLVLIVVSGCMVGEDEATEATPGASIVANPRLTGCQGTASTSIPSDGSYIVTTFGGPGDHQPMSCGGYADGTTWYAASRQRYGCGTKLRIEANGKCVVAAALDYGPDVCVERAASAPIVDVSPLVARALFGESGLGYSDRKRVTVTAVAASTALGMCATTSTDDPAPPPPPPSAATCMSSTLDREVDGGTCVQAAADGAWYACEAGAWVPRTSAAGCAAAYGWCNSATLGLEVAPRTCVQAASNGVWYQCNGQRWATPVTTSTRSGPVGACSTWNPL